MKKTILFYSSVKTKRMFSIQKFYKTDITILKDLGYNVALSNSMVDYLCFWKYDIAFIYFYRYGLIPAMLAKLFFKKVVFTGGIDYLDREYAGKKSYTTQKLFFILCNLFSDKSILVSNSDAKNIKKIRKSLPPSKFPLSFHVINYENFEYNEILGKKKIFCTIAWMLRSENVIRKGVDKSILLFKEIYKLDPQFRMVIVGPKGEGSKLIEKMISDEKLGNAVTLTGEIDEKTKISILKDSSVYSQLSIYEGFGIAAIEALAAGNIVVHTGQGGLSDAVGDNGILVKNENYQETSKKIIQLLSNENLKQKMILKGIKHVSENFRYNKRLDDFKNIFESI